MMLGRCLGVWPESGEMAGVQLDSSRVQIVTRDNLPSPIKRLVFKLSRVTISTRHENADLSRQLRVVGTKRGINRHLPSAARSRK